MLGLVVTLLVCADPGATPAPLVPVDDLYERVLAYKRERLEVRPLNRATWITPMALPRDDAYDYDFVNPGWNQALPDLAPTPLDPADDWGIVQGAVQVLDDAQLADLLHDQPLRDHIAAERFWPRLWWGIGFGAASAASLGTGSWMTWRDYDNADARRNGEAIGISLLTVGVATGLLAALYPAYAQHVLSPTDAAARCDAYNAALRQSLRLAPEDLQRF